jgi:nucleotide-binding universal stress UspA family protein
MFPYKRILVALDGSPISDRALDEALSIARQTGAKLQLVHVVDELGYISGFEAAAACYVEDIVPIMRGEGEKLLADGCRKAAAQGVTAEACLVMSRGERVCDAVTEQARRSEADLLVLGSHGRRGAKRWLLGSDAEQILRISPVPVLLIHMPEGGMQKAVSELVPEPQ